MSRLIIYESDTGVISLASLSLYITMLVYQRLESAIFHYLSSGFLLNIQLYRCASNKHRFARIRIESNLRGSKNSGVGAFVLPLSRSFSLKYMT